jgi:hypothetical protein
VALISYEGPTRIETGYDLGSSPGVTTHATVRVHRRQWLAALTLATSILLGVISVGAHQVEGGPAAGGLLGSAFSLDCGADHVLIGIAGIAGAWIDGLQAFCVRIRFTGQWLPPIKRTSHVGSKGRPLILGGAPHFEVKCPGDYAVSGIDGRAGFFVDQIRILCKRIAPGGVLTGEAIPQTPAGGGGGNPFYQLNCPADHPGRRLTGASGVYVDRVQLHCDHPVPQVIGSPTAVSPFCCNIEISTRTVVLDWAAQDGAAWYRLCVEERGAATTRCNMVNRIKTTATQRTVDLRGREGRTIDWATQGCNSLDQCGPEGNSVFKVAPTLR